MYLLWPVEVASKKPPNPVHAQWLLLLRLHIGEQRGSWKGLSLAPDLSEVSHPPHGCSVGNQGTGTVSELCCPLRHHTSLLVPAQGRSHRGCTSLPCSLEPVHVARGWEASQSSPPQKVDVLFSLGQSLQVIPMCCLHLSLSVCLSPLILRSRGQQGNKGRSTG